MHIFGYEVWPPILLVYFIIQVDGPCCFSKRRERLDSETHVATRVSGESCGPAAGQPWEAGPAPGLRAGIARGPRIARGPHFCQRGLGWPRRQSAKRSGFGAANFPKTGWEKMPF